MPANILNHLFQYKCFHQYVTVVYDFQTIFEKLAETELKKRRIIGKKDQSFTVKTRTHVPTNFALIAYYSKEALTNECEYFTYRGKDCKDAFADFANFPKKIFLQKKSRQIIVRENLSQT